MQKDKKQRSRRDVLKVSAVGLAGLSSLPIAGAKKSDADHARRYENANVSANNRNALHDYAEFLMGHDKQTQQELVDALPARKREAIYDVFRPKDVEYVVETLDGGSDGVTSTEVSTQGFTQQVTYSARIKNQINTVVATFYNNVEWTYDINTGIISAADSWGSGSAGGIGWNYEGVVASSETGGAGDESFDSYKKGKFTYCPAGYCIDSATAWVYVLVDGDGNHRAEGAPNLRLE